MKKLSLMLALAILLAGGAIGATSTSSGAQVYPPPPQNLYATPWVGANTPWVFYNGDWFLNGSSALLFWPSTWMGSLLRLCSYLYRQTQSLVCASVECVVPGTPALLEEFSSPISLLAEHRYGHRYNENFYHQHHRGQGAGWQKGLT